MVQMRVAEQVLTDPLWERKWRSPAQRSSAESPTDLPTVLKVNFRWTDRR
jgi:hypothetical protein